MYFELLGEINNIEIIAIGNKIREVKRLEKQYGKARWRKLKGIGKVRLQNGQVRLAELHWYEAHGIGRKRMKIKKLLE